MGRAASVLLILAAAATASCKADRKLGTRSGAYAATVKDAIPRLERSTGLTFKTPPRLESKTRDEVRQFLEKRFETETPSGEVSGLERAYKRLQLLPDTMDLRKFLLALLTEQVAGYYDPAAKTLYVVDGAPPDIVNVTIRHELVHALQDEYISLDSLQKQHDDNDRQTAAQSIIEGQATLEQMGGANIATNMPGGWDRVRQLIRESQSSMPVFAAAPLLLQETLIFPYLSGAEFVRRFKDHYHDRSPLSRLPVSTEQIMHEDRFFGSEPDAPTHITLPAPSSGKKVYENGLGEFETRLFLYEYLNDQSAAVRGAAGWDGDRYLLVDTGKGDAISWLTVWDTSVDAAEFFDLVDTGLLKKHPGMRPLSASGSTHTYSVGGRTIQIRATDIGGRPVVLFVDVPSGTSPEIVNLKQVTISE